MTIQEREATKDFSLLLDRHIPPSIEHFINKQTENKTKKNPESDLASIKLLNTRNTTEDLLLWGSNHQNPGCLKLCRTKS